MQEPVKDYSKHIRVLYFVAIGLILISLSVTLIGTYYFEQLVDTETIKP